MLAITLYFVRPRNCERHCYHVVLTTDVCGDPEPASIVLSKKELGFRSSRVIQQIRCDGICLG